MTSHYSHNFFRRRAAGAHYSAEQIVPLVFELLKPASIIDIGCGDGSWLKAFQDLGVKDILGLDNGQLDSSNLLINQSNFRRQDLEQRITLLKKYDLAINLEVIEHLSRRRGPSLIADLCKLSDIILFSAAVPDQGGPGHINERWPEYWKKIFYQQDYIMLDPFRPQIAADPKIDWWYKQNLFLVINQKLLTQIPFNTLPLYTKNIFYLNKHRFINSRFKYRLIKLSQKLKRILWFIMIRYMEPKKFPSLLF